MHCKVGDDWNHGNMEKQLPPAPPPHCTPPPPHRRVAERAGRALAQLPVAVGRQVADDGREGEDVAAGRDLGALRRPHILQGDGAAHRLAGQQLHLCIAMKREGGHQQAAQVEGGIQQHLCTKCDALLSQILTCTPQPTHPRPPTHPPSHPTCTTPLPPPSLPPTPPHTPTPHLHHVLPVQHCVGVGCVAPRIGDRVGHQEAEVGLQRSAVQQVVVVAVVVCSSNISSSSGTAAVAHRFGRVPPAAGTKCTRQAT